MHLMGFFVSNYLNQVAPSGQRATVLSFKGLASNMAYGTVSLMYSALIASIKLSEGGRTFGDEALFRKSVFVDSLAWFPGYFVLTVVLVFVVQRLRFGKRSTTQQ